MSNQPNMIQSTAMPPQVVPAMPAGATSPMSAGVKLQEQQNTNQMALIGQGKSGGSKRRYLRRGGAAVVQVPPVPSGTVNPDATGGNYQALTSLSQNTQTQAVFDTATTPAQTAGIAAQQQALYKGGSSRRGKRGGSWPVWGCFSGGKKSRRRGRKSCKCKKRKNKRTKRHRH
jgi:hypothetical protein